MEKTLADKLRYKQGRAIILNAPNGLNMGINSESVLEGTFEYLQLFVNNFQELEIWVPQVIDRLNDNAIFWICYPKQTSKIKTDINRDIIFKMVGETTDYRIVSNVAIDDTWSALRLRLKKIVENLEYDEK